MSEPDQPDRGRIKCVVWDLDNTLLAGTWLEADAPPGLAPAMEHALRELSGRGILASVASRNPAEAAGALPPVPFLAPQFGWGRKSDSVRRVAAELNLGVDALAFVDDDPYERAEVTLALPEVLVLAPEDVPDALGWPEFRPPVVTDEARARAASYAQARERERAARGSGQSTPEFLRWAGTELTISPATERDLPRLAELSARTHQFNSVRRAVPDGELRAWLDSPDYRVTVLRLRDRFGDDGLIGAAVVHCGHGPEWTVELLMMSCRAMGRGVIEALLAHLCRSAEASSLAVPARLDERNVPLRLALVTAGFRATEAGEITVFRRALDTSPELPDWVVVL